MASEGRRGEEKTEGGFDHSLNTRSAVTKEEGDQLFPVPAGDGTSSHGLALHRDLGGKNSLSQRMVRYRERSRSLHPWKHSIQPLAGLATPQLAGVRHGGLPRALKELAANAERAGLAQALHLILGGISGASQPGEGGS